MKTEIKTTTLLDFIEIYNKYEHLIEKYIMKICPEYIDSEDFIQDAKLGLLEYIKYNEAFHKLTDSKLRTIYVSQYMSRLIDRLHRRYLSYSKSLNLYDFENDLIYTYDYDVCGLKEVINRALNTLPENEANVIKLYFYEDLTLNSISSLEGLSQSRVYQILLKALRKLRYPSITEQLKTYIED